MPKSPERHDTLKIEYVSPHSLKPYPANARTHNRRQRRALAASIRRFGYTQPVLVTNDGEIIAGHARVEAAKSVGLPKIPIIRIDHLSETERRAYILADNKLALQAGWDRELLATELQNLIEVGFDVEVAGFDPPEVDLILDAAAETRDDATQDDVTPDLQRDQPAITQRGDTWLFGTNTGRQHRLICDDAREGSAVASVMGRDNAAMVITDPPYNVHVPGHVSGKGRNRHADFAMASGEMSEGDFISFLRQFLAAALTRTASGALLYLFMDWRHLFEILTASKLLDMELVNLCVWNKSNGGLGSLYRSKHELVLIFRHGDKLHRNNIELGKNGRNRSNVWDYAGANAFGSGRDSELAMHPTVKPVAMIADAIRDVTKRGPSAAATPIQNSYSMKWPSISMPC